MPETSNSSPVIVTGGASGIGFAIAKAFTQKSYPVAIVDVSLKAAADAADRLAAENPTPAIGVAADVSDTSACEAAFNEIESTLGPASVLVNNAGFMPPRKGWIEEIPHEDFQHMMNVHVGGAVNWCRLVMPAMRSAGFGRIINMSSGNGVLPVPHRFAYVTAKKALRGLTEALALDCARAGITVNAIAPGYIMTDTLRERAEAGLISHNGIAEHTPVGRWGEPDEIAHMALFLAEPESGFITGTTMVVDGGITIRGDAAEDLNNSPFTKN